MRYELRVTAYDVMDKVTVSVVLYDTSTEGRLYAESVLDRVDTLPGTGEADPLRWTRDALVQALETL